MIPCRQGELARERACHDEVPWAELLVELRQLPSQPCHGIVRVAENGITLPNRHLGSIDPNAGIVTLSVFTFSITLRVVTRL